MAANDKSTQNEVERLRSKHPYWSKMNPEWAFYLSAYEGGKDFACADNLFKHTRENKEDYDDRVNRLHNLNYCEPIIDFFTNFIFSEPIDRSGGTNEGFFKEFVKDVDRRGTNIDAFMKQVCDEMQIYGMTYVMVDAPVIPTEAVISKAKEQELGIRPYWVLVRPNEIIDWVTDDFLNLIYLKRLQEKDRIVNGKRITVEVYTEITTATYKITEIDKNAENIKDAVLSSAVLPNKLGKVPVYPVRFKPSKKNAYIGLSFLRDFAYNNREIMNLTSLLQEFLYRQAFNILAREIDSTVPIQEQQEGDLGTSNVMEIPKGAAMPQYLSPPATPAEFIQSERSRIKAEMYTRAAQDTMNELFNGEKSSGFSQAQSFSKTVPHISSRADTLESAEVALMELTMEMMGKEWDGKIKYKDRYEITNLTDALTQLLMILNDLKLPSETFVKEELKKVVRGFDGKLPADTLAKIMKEIDEMDYEKWQSKLQKPSNASAGAQQKPKQTGTMQEVMQEAKVDKTAATVKVRDKRNRR